MNNRGIYVGYGSTEDIPKEDAFQLRLWRFDSIELKQVTSILKTKYQKVSSYFWLSQEAIFDLFILYSTSFWQKFKT